MKERKDINYILALYILSKYDAKDYTEATTKVRIQDVQKEMYFNQPFRGDLRYAQDNIEQYSPLLINVRKIDRYIYSNLYKIRAYKIALELAEYKEKHKLSYRHLSVFFGVSRTTMHNIIKTYKFGEVNSGIFDKINQFLTESVI